MTRAGHAFELLRAANPVPGEKPRAHRRRRAPLVLAFVALLLCFLLVAPAIGIRIPPLAFWAAEKAPPKVVEDFATLSEGAPPGMDPGAIPGETRKVTLADGQVLWVAPTRYGGFCTLGRAGGGCDKLGTVPLSVGWQAGRIPFAEMTRPGGPPATAFISISGYADAKYTKTVEVRFADGDVEQLDLVWVSEPIGAGFFHYEIPSQHRRTGHEIASVVALDDDGDVVTEDSRRAPLRAPQPEAIVEEKSVALAVVAGEGRAVIWKAPTRYEGRCTWLEFGGTATAVGPCMPRGYERQVGFGLGVRAIGGESFLVGTCGYAAIELLRPDGTRRRVACIDGLVLARLADAELEGDMWAIDAAGRPLARSRVPLTPKGR